MSCELVRRNNGSNSSAFEALKTEKYNIGTSCEQVRTYGV